MTLTLTLSSSWPTSGFSGEACRGGWPASTCAADRACCSAGSGDTLSAMMTLRVHELGQQRLPQLAQEERQPDPAQADDRRRVHPVQAEGLKGEEARHDHP